MGKFVNQSDFVGEYNIPLDKFTKENLDRYIDQYEKSMLIKMFGAELYKEFIADFDAPTAGQPTDPKFVAVYEQILLDEQDCDILYSEGIPVMLKGFIYFFFVRDLRYKVTMGGAVKNVQADAEEALFGLTNEIDMYNRAAKYFWTMQYYMECYNPNNYDYNKFNGRLLEPISPI